MGTQPVAKERTFSKEAEGKGSHTSLIKACELEIDFTTKKV